MYHIHSTEGFVLGSKPYREAGKIIQIFTRELGLVWAIAEGIRLEKSKLRYYIQDYSFARFSLVHGKEFWRIVGVAEYNLKIDKKKEILNILAPIALVLKRLVQGEQAHEEIFDCLDNCLDYMCDNTLKDTKEAENNEEIRTLESLMVIRILYRLGYIGDDSLFGLDLKDCKISGELVESLKSHRIELNKKINVALKESHL